ncbi:hypothetical protein [Paenibacillus donghaensis]|uniref:Uncharacterized protein n=1 Tax=Paenibacillus donghaensis TaxID=414771 RepID=A0A2Z2KAX7_9BACL|nr:hypothetical protein [Paenibacillus donghaensis]ASA22667.1 hypothetical protein B9T62_18845 [Paenibacillus donghaensis]
MDKAEKEMSREYWSKRIYDEILAENNTHETFGFDYKKIDIGNDKMVIDVQLSITFNEENRKDNIKNTLQKIQKTLEILLRTDKDNHCDNLK